MKGNVVQKVIWLDDEKVILKRYKIRKTRSQHRDNSV